MAVYVKNILVRQGVNYGIGRTEYEGAARYYSGLRQRWTMTISDCEGNQVDTVYIQ